MYAFQTLTACFSKSNEDELRKAAVALLSRISPASFIIDGRKTERKPSAFTFSGPLEQDAMLHVSTSKALLKDYRNICQEIIVARERKSTECNEAESIGQLRFLLEKQSGRLRTRIHAMLDGKEYPPRNHKDDAAEKELWTRFGETAFIGHVKNNQGEIGEEWVRDTKNSEKALRRLVKYLPVED